MCLFSILLLMCISSQVDQHSLICLLKHVCTPFCYPGVELLVHELCMLTILDIAKEFQSGDNNLHSTYQCSRDPVTSTILCIVGFSPHFLGVFFFSFASLQRYLFLCVHYTYVYDLPVQVSCSFFIGLPFPYYLQQFFIYSEFKSFVKYMCGQNILCISLLELS